MRPKKHETTMSSDLFRARLEQIYGLSDEGVCERWVHDPYFQHFTGYEFFQYEFPHERSDLSHWRKRLGDKLDVLLADPRLHGHRCEHA